jgi:hypothetical protein
MRKFRLLKDIVSPIGTIPAGTIFTKEQEGCAYRNRELDEAYHSLYVEDNPTWFEEVQEKQWTDTDMRRFLTQYADKWAAHTGMMKAQECLDDYKKHL